MKKKNIVMGIILGIVTVIAGCCIIIKKSSDALDEEFDMMHDYEE